MALDWVVTLPQHIEWADYERELAAVRDGTRALNYRLARAPRELRAGDRCFLVWRGRVRGWMEVIGEVTHAQGFVCGSTGQRWAPGTYLQRSGEFHPVAGPALRGFQGIRRFRPAPPAD